MYTKLVEMYIICIRTIITHLVLYQNYINLGLGPMVLHCFSGMKKKNKKITTRG